MAGQSIALSADSTTLVLNGTTITDFVEGDYIVFAPTNAVTSRINGANGITVIKKRMDGDIYDLTINVIKYSDSDVFLNSLVNESTPAVISGSCKENHVKNGDKIVISWNIENGSITTPPTDTRNNQDGNAAMTYVIQCNATRVL